MKGKVVLVTGGSKGIGRETARIFGNRGARVWITGRDEQALRGTAENLASEGIEARYAVSDVRDPESCRRVIEEIISRDRALDAVILNAGMSMRGSVEETDLSVYRTMMEINYLGSVNVAAYALKYIRRSRGSIVFISTVAALHGLPGTGPYGASKIALKVLSESLRCESAGDGVHVGIVYVGFTENDPGKVVYDEKGNLIELKRPRNSQTQQQSAACIYRCVKKRRKVITLSMLGKFAALMFRLFPGLSGFLVRRTTRNNRMYGDR